MELRSLIAQFRNCKTASTISSCSIRNAKNRPSHWKNRRHRKPKFRRRLQLKSPSRRLRRRCEKLNDEKRDAVLYWKEVSARTTLKAKLRAAASEPYLRLAN